MEDGGLRMSRRYSMRRSKRWLKRPVCSKVLFYLLLHHGRNTSTTRTRARAWYSLSQRDSFAIAVAMALKILDTVHLCMKDSNSTLTFEQMYRSNIRMRLCNVR
jgi:hypothetical protein